MTKYLLIASLLVFSSCYKKLDLEGFDKSKWQRFGEDCNTYRLDVSKHILANRDVLLEATQNEVESLLGSPREHELYQRNQKFFHYRLTPPDTCGEFKTIHYLSIRFNAIGRANLVQEMLRDTQ